MTLETRKDRAKAVMLQRFETRFDELEPKDLLHMLLVSINITTCAVLGLLAYNTGHWWGWALAGLLLLNSLAILGWEATWATVGFNAVIVWPILALTYAACVVFFGLS